MVNMNFDAYSSANMCGACGTRGACSGGRCPGPEASGILASGGINCCPGCASAIGCEGGDCPGPSACLRVRFGMRGNTHGNVGCTLSLAKREYSRANNTLQELPRTPGRGRLFPTPETKQSQPRLPGPPEGNFPLIPPPPPPTTEQRYPNQPEQPRPQIMQPRSPAPPKPLAFQPLPSQPGAPQGSVAQAMIPQQPAGPVAQVAYAAPPPPAPVDAVSQPVKAMPYAEPPTPVTPMATKTSAPLPSKGSSPLGPITHAAGAVNMYGIPAGYGPRPSGQTATVRVTVPAPPRPPPPPPRPLTAVEAQAAAVAGAQATATRNAQIDADRQVALERQHTITSIATTAGEALGTTAGTITAIVASSNATALERLRIQSAERLEAMRLDNARAAAAAGGTITPAAQAQMDAVATLQASLAARLAELAAAPPAPTVTLTQGLTAAPTAEEAAAARNKTMLYVGLGVVGVAAVGGVAYLALRKKDEPKHNPSLPSYPPGAYASQYGVR